jgi:aminoglycoside adenylyltransferase-like protein/nucleotidyltransferase-like protein
LQTHRRPSEEIAYLARLCGRLRGAMGEATVGVYAGGSWALGDYLPGRSDLDVAAVVNQAPSAESQRAVVASVRHEALPCPARRLELVVYRLDTARSGSPASDFDLNLNTGRGMETLARSQGVAGAEGSHWFAIDRSILSQAGIPLFGPPASEVFAAIPPAALAPTLIRSLRWHGVHADTASDAVLNACRSLRYAQEGRWSSKPAAGRWALDRGLAPADLVSRAIEGRRTQTDLDPARVRGFLEDVESRLRPEPT